MKNLDIVARRQSPVPCKYISQGDELTVYSLPSLFTLAGTGYPVEFAWRVRVSDLEV